MDTEGLKNYEQARSQMFVELIPKNGNEELLANVPHREMEDLAAIVRVDLGNANEMHATAFVTNALAEQYGISGEQLLKEAIENATHSYPAMLDSLSNVLGIPEMADGPQLYVASVEGSYMGAGVLTYPGFLDQAAERLGGDFFVLPSSIHEVLLMKDDGTQLVSDLEQIVRSVNKNEVIPQERLSDHVYRYDGETRTFELADRHEQRLAEKTNDRSSVMKELSAAKKAEPAHKPKTPRKSKDEAVL